MSYFPVFLYGHFLILELYNFFSPSSRPTIKAPLTHSCNQTCFFQKTLCEILLTKQVGRKVEFCLQPTLYALASLTFTDAGFEFDICYTSVLKRATRTLWLVLDGIDQMWVPVHRTWRLNERHYGGLTGLNKAETAAKHGEAQVKIWRRSFDIPPPPMGPDHDYYAIISKVRYDICSTYTRQPKSFVGL